MHRLSSEATSWGNELCMVAQESYPSPTLRANRVSENRSATLEEALQKFSQQVPAEQLEQLDRYCQLLWDWNSRMNLTRHTDYDLFVSRDLLDTLRLATHLRADTDVLDVGTGGGVPGVLLAILRPDLRVSLAESVGKKAKAVDDIVGQLDLPVPVYAARAESILDDFRFDTLVARAVGPLWKMMKWFEDHWASIGELLLIKGPGWVDERAEARHRGWTKQVALRKIDSYPTPGRDQDSVILRLVFSATAERETLE
ncbi:MAG: 16S rRNA (guanine(527)-N(7))-methyltransferase RsmG [Blastopirellula sp.]|nr:16S rRNA (guanine(527)-N(7))-methyltransferase RsmG [Blastopirellula sp.]